MQSRKLKKHKKKILIKLAQGIYRRCFTTRCAKEPLAIFEIDINTFKEACEHMSNLVHFLAKELFIIPESENKIYHCVFKYDGACYSHYFNVICDEIVDSTIMQFGDLSPYENHDERYTKKEECENDYYSIKEEIEYFNALKQKKRLCYIVIKTLLANNKFV